MIRRIAGTWFNSSFIMKELRFFYNPEPRDCELPEEEAGHAVRVLRLTTGDEIWIMDGKGTFYQCTITETTKKRCLYQIDASLPQQPEWEGRIHLAIGPTKNMDRMEWMAEKVTEIGLDELTFLNCEWSERRVIKTERIEKIVVSAMKQSRKSRKPKVNEMTDIMDFIREMGEEKGQKFICHCHEGERPLLKDLYQGGDVTVMIGPEGDFSPEEVEAAEKAGFVAVSLGSSRLRTETAGMVSVCGVRYY